jgi:hypothetical protein
MPLTKAEARLEALKLAVRPGLDGNDIIATAERYRAFIEDGQIEPAPVEKPKGKVKP